MSEVSFPLVLTAQGPQPTPPSTIQTTLTNLVSAEVPGYTNDLPGILIEDISSTDVFAISICDQARVEYVNSLTPYGSNAFTLTQLGSVYGVPLGQNTNTNVNLVFTTEPPAPGFVISSGFTVSDGTYQYVVQTGGVIGSGGTTLPLFAIATQSGSWEVPAGTVTTLVTSVPATITLSVTNPAAGTPSPGAQSEESYRAQVLQAGLAASQGMPRYLKTLLGQIPGVQPRLVSVLQGAGGGWEVIAAGGDPYFMAFAVFQALFDVSTLVGSTLLVTGITNANPGVVTTNLNHGYSTGQIVQINGVVGMTGINGVNLTITVLTQTTFSIGIDTTSSGAYASGGVVTPNLRNQIVNINDFPNTYGVPIVTPPLQNLSLLATWNTVTPSTPTNFVNPAAVAQAVVPALVAYINSIYAGQPLNLNQAASVFLAAVEPLIDVSLIGELNWVVEINGIVTAPAVGTQTVYGDPESYFFATTASVNAVQA